MRLRFPGFLLLCLAAIRPLAAADRPLAIDTAESRIDVVVHATVDSFTGQLKAFEPTVILGDDGRVKAARLAFHFRDVVTGKDKRDKSMHAWQQTDTHPDGEFVLTSAAPAPAGGNDFIATGRLTFHGVTREIRFPFTLVQEGPLYRIEGDATLDTREYGLPIIRMLAILKVDPIVHVRFHLQGTAANPARS